MKTVGRWALKQPTFNESVIARQPRFFNTDNVQRLKQITELTDYFLGLKNFGSRTFCKSVKKKSDFFSRYQK